MSGDDSTPTSSSRAPLPEGTLPVAAGLMVAGIGSYAFFMVGKWALGSDEAFKPIASMWFAVFALAPGFFLPLEQELGRALSARRAIGQGGRPVAQRVIRLGMLMGAVVIIAMLVASPLIVSNYFDGDWVMVAALITALVAYAPAHVSRGICSGMGRFRGYAVVLGADGVVRIALCALLAIVGVKTAGPFGFAVALAPMFGVLYVWRRGDLRTDPGPESSWSEVTPNLGWLLLGSVFAASLVNAGPVAATLLATDADDKFVSQFSYGVLLARVPLFLFQAVQAALLPRLSRLAARNELGEFRAGFRRLMVVVLGVGAFGVTGAYVLGPWAVKLAYDADLSRSTLAMLALASATYMVALAIAQAVIALRGHALVALGWGTGMAVFLLATWLSSDELFKRIEIGLVASSTAALCVFAWSLRRRLAAGAEPDPQSVMEAITDMPFET